MKKLLVLLAVVTICTPVLAVKQYVCSYQKGKTTYFYKYNPGESAEQFCEIECISNYAKKPKECTVCKKELYFRVQKDYEAGKCEKIQPPKTYKNVKGCDCDVYLDESGRLQSCDCQDNGSGTCNKDKAFNKIYREHHKQK